MNIIKQEIEVIQIVTLDVTSLHTYIPQNEASEVIEYILNKREEGQHPPMSF